METVPITLQPTTVSEWDSEDALNGVLSGDTPLDADPARAQAMLNKITVALPKAIDWTELVTYAGSIK